MKNSVSKLYSAIFSTTSFFTEFSLNRSKEFRRTWDNPRKRRKLLKRFRSFFTKAIKSILLLFLIFDFSLAPLMAQPTLFRDLWKNGSDGKLERQYQNAENSTTEADWDKSLKRGKDLLKADWEARADEEIDRELAKNGKTNDATAKADLENEKQLNLQQWETEVQSEIDSRKGEWKARIASSSLTDLISNLDRETLRQAVLGAENASKTGTNATEKVQLFDQSLNGVLGAFRANWEDQLDTRIGGLAGALTFQSAAEFNSFQKALGAVKNYFISEYYYEESSIVAGYRAGFVARENQNDDLSGQIAQETDPSKLALLLIDRAKRSIDQNFAGVVPQNGTVINQPNLTVEGADQFQTQALKALEDGQKQWQSAIDDLLLGKLRFDRQSELERKNGEAEWTDAYGKLLKAREDWSLVVKAQIQKGLEAWDTSENNLQQNKQAALAELDRTLATGKEQWQAHVRGVESVVSGGADTLTTIESNKQFFQEALSRAQQPNSGYNSTIIAEYSTQLTYWTNLEGRVRTLVANAQNSLHDTDVRGTGVGQGLLYDAGGADKYIYTSTELELRIAQAELKVLQDKRDRAQSVYDYAVQNVAQKTQEQLAADLATMKTDFQAKEQAYLNLLKELNGGGTGTSYSTPGMDSNSTASAAVDGAVAGANLLSDLEAANKLMEEKRKALETARANMETSRASYDSVVKMQVLINNPQLLGQIGQLSSDGEKAENTGLRSDIANANRELEEKREVLRQQEQKMYELTYEKANALRTQTFYNQTLQQVLAFEALKDNKAKIEGIIGGTGTLNDKIDSLLSGDNLVTVYGNDLALQIRNNLTQLKTQLVDLDTPVMNSATGFDAQATGIKNAADQFPTIDYAQKKQDLTNYLNQMVAARNNLANINNLDTSYLAIDRLDQGIDYLESLLANWDDVADGMTDGLDAIRTSSGDYLTYSASHAADKGTLSYSNQMLSFSGQLQNGVNGVGQFQSYLAEIGQTKQFLDTALLDSIQRGGVLVETTLTGGDRTLAQQFFANIKSGADQNGKTLQNSFTSVNESFNGLGASLGTFGESLKGFRNSLETRNGKVSQVSAALLSLYESLESEFQGRKAQLEFLLDQNGSETSLTQIQKNLENTRNLEGAKINEIAMEKLIDYLKDLPASERNIDSIYLKVLKDSDARLADLKLGPNELEDRKATELVLAFIKNQNSALARSLASPDYDDFIESLETQLGSATQIRSFYEGGGTLTDTQRNDIRENGTAEQRRTLNEYYSFGSTFFFGQEAVSKVATMDATVQGFGSFANSVRTGQVLSTLRDDYFKAQENKTNGLLKELQTLIPGFNDLTASALYQDSFVIGDQTDHDTAEEDRRKNLLQELLSGLNTNESLLTGLGDLDVLRAYYGDATAVKIYGETLNLSSELEAKKADYASVIGNIGPVLDSATYPAEDLLNFLTPSLNSYYAGQLNYYTNFIGLKNYTDPDTSLQTFNGIDFSIMNPYITSIQDNLGLWTAKKDALQMSVDSFVNLKTELSILGQGSPAYEAKLNEVTTALVAMNSAYSEVKDYFSILSSDAIQLNAKSQVILKDMKTNAGVPNNKIVTDMPTLVTLPPGMQDAYNVDSSSFYIVSGTAPASIGRVIEWEAGLAQNGIGTFDSQNAFNTALNARSSSAGLFLNQLAASKADLDATNTKITNFKNGLENRIQVFMNQGSQNQISRETLAVTVENLRNFFLEKQYNGEEINPAILEALENAGVFTDEIEKLNYYKNIPVADRTEAKLNASLTDAKSYTTALGDAEKLFQSLRSTIGSIEQTGKPLSLSIDQINDSLKKYEDLKTKLDGKAFALDSNIVSGMESLKEFSWENHKSTLVQAFLTRTGDSFNVNQFLNEIKSGKYVLPGSNGTTIQKDAKFLGKDLTAAQLAELTEQLNYYADQSTIQNVSLASGLDAFLSTQDPTLKAELQQKAVSVGYQRILASLNQGVFSDVSSLPASLTNFAIISNYNAFLASKTNWNANNAADRDAARSEYLLRVGGDHGEAAVLSDYLSNYSSRNSSYYLPDFLKEAEVLQSYYSRQATDNLQPDDLASLTTWLQNKKYEPSLVQALNKAVRMDTILSNYSGEDTTEYLNYSNSKLAGGLSDAEKEGFFLNQSGAYNPFGNLNPASEIQTNQLLRDFQFRTGFKELADTFDTDGLRLAKAKAQAQRDENTVKYSYDLVKGNIIVESYLSYLNIGPKGQLEPSQDTQITNRLRELEFQAEHRLGGFMNLVEGYKSFAFDPDKEDQNPSIRRALEDFSTSGYTVRDEVYTKDGSGNYTFMAGINNLKGIIDNYVDNNLPGRSANEDPYSESGSAKGSMSGSASAIIDAGKSIGIITNINNTLQGLTGDNLTNKLAEQLKTVKDNFLAAENTFEDAQTQLNQQKLNVDNAQASYTAKQTQVTAAYGAFNAAQASLSNLSAVYDYAVLANYTQHQSDANADSTVTVGKPIDLAKQRLDAANDAVNAKLKEVQDLQTRVNNQTTLASLQADPNVALNKQQTEEWAERALRFSQAETVIKDRMQDLKSQIAAKRSELQGFLNDLVVPPGRNFNENGLNGLIDPNTSGYKNLETKLRGEYSIMEGVLGGKIGFWDFVNGGRGEANPPRYGGGLALEYPDYNILGYVQSLNGGSSAIPSKIKQAQDGFDGMWVWNAGVWGEYSAGLRLQNGTYADYNNAMWNKFNQDQGAQALTIALMGWGSLAVGIAAIGKASAWATAQNNLNAAINTATAKTNELKTLQEKLNYYTDISTGDQLKSVLLGNGSIDSLNTGLNASDLDYLVGTGGKLTADSLKWSTGSGQDLNLDRIAGKNGNTVVQESYVHDAYGLLVRQGQTVPGGASASSTTYNSNGILVSFMTSADQFSSALAVLAKSQYQIEKREYFAAQEAYVGPGGQKADQKMILDDREGFYSGLIQTLSQNTGKNIEYEMYQTVVTDYMGEGQIVDQLYEINGEQQKQTQLKVWKQKEKEFYDKKQEWVQNIEFLQNTGNARFNDMLSLMNKNWDAWRTDFNAKQKEGEQAHIDAIAKALKSKADWEKDAIASLKTQGDGYEIRSAYDQIQNILNSMSASLPTDVGIAVNANTILNQVLLNRPAELDASLLQQGAYANVQFFVDQLQKTKLDDSSIKNFESLRKEMDESSKKVVVLQTLDSLWSLPVSFEETINGANKALSEQLTSQLANDEFIPAGGGYIRNVTGPTGNTEMQVLPGYNPYKYVRPDKLPTLMDSNNRPWDLTDYNALTKDGGPTTVELQSMVKLAREKMSQDFKKTYDPENTSNREVAAIAFDPMAQAKVFQSAQSALQRLFTDPQTALEFSLADDEKKAAMKQSAMDSGYLVGPTEGGAFGDHHFIQFYGILKLKEKYNETKQQGEAFKKDVLTQGAGAVFGPSAAAFVFKNKDIINTGIAIAATMVAGPAGAIAYAALQAANAYSSTGNIGSAIAASVGGAITGYTGGVVSLDTSWDPENGFGVSAGAFGQSVGYSQSGGFSASVGISLKNSGDVMKVVGAVVSTKFKGLGEAIMDAGTAVDKAVGNCNICSNISVGVSYSDQGGFGGAIGYKNKNGVTLGASYTKEGGISGAAGISTKSGYELGMSYSDAEGYGGYAAKNKSEEGKVVSQTALTLNDRDGFGVRQKNYSGDGKSANTFGASQRGGINAEYETESDLNLMKGKGIGLSANVGWDGTTDLSFQVDNYTATYNTYGGFSGAIQNQGWNAIIATDQSSLMSHMEEVNKNVAEQNYALDQGMRQYVSKYGFSIGEKEWAKLSDTEKEALVQTIATGKTQHTTRDEVSERLWGSVTDFADQLSGQFSDHAGWMEKDPKTNQMVFRERTCFVAGTLVHTKDGLKKIEEIQVGDVVLSKNDVSGEMSYRRVVNTFVRQTDAIYKVSFEDGTMLETTWNHPFRTAKLDLNAKEFKIENSKWTQAKDLAESDMTLTAEGEMLKVISLVIDQREETVFNFEVETDHTYFVGEEGIWVHNDNYGGGYVDAIQSSLLGTVSSDLEKVLDTFALKDRNSARALLARKMKSGEVGLVEGKMIGFLLENAINDYDKLSPADRKGWEAEYKTIKNNKDKLGTPSVYLDPEKQGFLFANRNVNHAGCHMAALGKMINHDTLIPGQGPYSSATLYYTGKWNGFVAEDGYVTDMNKMAKHYGAFNDKSATYVSGNTNTLNNIVTGKDGLNTNSFLYKTIGRAENYVLARFQNPNDPSRKHSEVITGTTSIQINDKTLNGYKLWDPGYNNDVFLDSNNGNVYRLDLNTNKYYLRNDRQWIGVTYYKGK
ncbi:polymorphic toxin-type HINT domain-containing protein [Leptospira kmetyi]|uniref:polymorphic toxin-type HINT domain-containing protein n=1 Tax=Leptospira kmetyi TaxID=408139 RepID=UPI003EC077B8